MLGGLQQTRGPNPSEVRRLKRLAPLIHIPRDSATARNEHDDVSLLGNHFKS